MGLYTLNLVEKWWFKGSLRVLHKKICYYLIRSSRRRHVPTKECSHIISPSNIQQIITLMQPPPYSQVTKSHHHRQSVPHIQLVHQMNHLHTHNTYSHQHHTIQYNSNSNDLSYIEQQTIQKAHLGNNIPQLRMNQQPRQNHL